MSEKFSRRDFLKLAGVGAATTADLDGLRAGFAYVTREPYTKMPEYTYNGLSTYYATTCRECAAGCGLGGPHHAGTRPQGGGQCEQSRQPRQDLCAWSGHLARTL